VSATTVSGRDPITGESLRVVIEDGRIGAVSPGSAGEQAWISPGFVDLQVNGFASHDFNAAGLRPETVAAAGRAIFATGATSFAPTLITAAEEHIHASLTAIAEARAADPVLRRAIPFVHVEGPHISAEDGPRGAHPAAHVRPPDLAEFDRWQSGSGNLVGMVTVSPHFESAPAYIAGLVERRVHVALGHTHATPAQVTAAVDAGAALSTHLGNGVAAFLPRHPNLLWAQLADDRLTATFIADGFHLSPETLKAMATAKGVDRSILVSDAVSLAGSAPGVYESPIGGRVELTADGRLGIVGTPYLAGAARPLADGVAIMASQVGFSLGNAVRMVTRNPARFTRNVAALIPGAPADIVRFYWHPREDTRVRIDAVLLAGVDIG
jgi:N-acetylglucosamine-6-phosphate deacetylase